MVLCKLARSPLIRAIRSYFSQPRFWLIVLAGIALGLRFWQLARFNTLVFDEVYFVNFAQAYRQRLAPADAHPPLGKYIIAAGIQLGSWLNSTAKTTPAVGIAPFSYRQANALIGSLVPLIVVGIARTVSRSIGQTQSTVIQWPRQRQRQWQRQWQFTLLSGLFVATDGLFITESRYALLNVHMVCLGLLSHMLWLKAALTPDIRHSKKVLLQTASGCFLGSAIAVKWNGLGYLLSLLIWEIWHCHSSKNKTNLKSLVYLILIATITYSLIWWPHLRITQENLFSVHAHLFSFHQHIGTSGHAACSRWYSWPLLIRPITYEYIRTESQAYTVSNLGNPVLWLLSSSAMLLLTINYALPLKHARSRKLKASRKSPQSDIIGPYLLISYLCNWLPWMPVQRCTFNYLYMPAAIFGFMSLAWLLSQWLNAPSKPTQVIAWLMLSLIAIAFLFWLPLTLGLPLSPQALKTRWLLKSWM